VSVRERGYAFGIARAALSIATGCVCAFSLIFLFRATPHISYRLRRPDASAFCKQISVNTPADQVLANVNRHVPPSYEEYSGNKLVISWQEGRCDSDVDPSSERVIKTQMLESGGIEWDSVSQ